MKTRVETIETLGKNLPQTSALLKAIAHPIRLKILKLLEGGEMSVGGLLDQLELPQAIISTHLAVLRRGHVVTVRDLGPNRLYKLSDDSLLDLIRTAEAIAPAA
jgi:ArsR family transcriptional regulator